MEIHKLNKEISTYENELTVANMERKNHERLNQISDSRYEPILSDFEALLKILKVYSDEKITEPQMRELEIRQENLLGQISIDASVLKNNIGSTLRDTIAIKHMTPAIDDSIIYKAAELLAVLHKTGIDTLFPGLTNNPDLPPPNGEDEKQELNMYLLLKHLELLRFLSY